MMRSLILACGLLAAFPAAARSQQVNTHDAASCLAYAEQMDTKAKSGGKFTQQEEKSLTERVQNFICPQFIATRDAGQIPDDAVSTNVKAMRFTLQTCGKMPTAAQEPPKPKQLVPESAFGQEPESEFK